MCFYKARKIAIFQASRIHSRSICIMLGIWRFLGNQAAYISMVVLQWLVRAVVGFTIKQTRVAQPFEAGRRIFGMNTGRMTEAFFALFLLRKKFSRNYQLLLLLLLLLRFSS